MANKRSINGPRPIEEYIQSKIKKGYEFRLTTDQWYPNFPGNTVSVSPVLNLTNGTFRVCVWGADDFGMEIDVDTWEEAFEIRNKLPKIISIKDLTERGFIRA